MAVRRRLLVTQGILVLLALILGMALMFWMAALRKPPAQADISEQKLKVEARLVQPEDVPVMITGFGTARSLDIVVIMPQVAGKVIEIHPRLEQGEIIPGGELLFRIEPRDYETAVAQAEAKVNQMRTTITMLKRQYENDQARLPTLKRTRDLAELEFTRDQTLFKQHEVGTETMVNMAEVNFNQMDDAYTMIRNAIELYPIRIQEAGTGLAAAEALLDQAQTGLERTEVRAPFTGRVKMAQLEIGQCVAPGAPAVTLANDSMIELSVPLDSRDAGSWLQFNQTRPVNGDSWFASVEPVECRIRWTEKPDANYWAGTLSRVERFDPMTRTVTVAVRVTGAAAMLESGNMPLVDGMFCSVEIPGETLRGVYRLPRWAVTFESEAFVANAESRLERRKVKIARTEGEDVYVSEGLQAGDRVVVTRLVSPLPNSLLECALEAAASASHATNPAANETLPPANAPSPNPPSGTEAAS